MGKSKVQGVRACVCACVRACVRTWVRACVRVCVCAHVHISVCAFLSPAAVFGSINFVTMDMLSYSFNGVGEYILLNVANSVGWTNKIQARFERLANTNVSVMTAIVCASQSGMYFCVCDDDKSRPDNSA